MLIRVVGIEEFSELRVKKNKRKKYFIFYDHFTFTGFWGCPCWAWLSLIYSVLFYVFMSSTSLSRLRISFYWSRSGFLGEFVRLFIHVFIICLFTIYRLIHLLFVYLFIYLLFMYLAIHFYILIHPPSPLLVPHLLGVAL
jgi:hypothetical protein